jgi:hypothetical protein
MNNTTADAPFDAGVLRACYEQLRGEELSSTGGIHRGFGFALLVRTGLAAWILACRESFAASQRPVQSSRLSQPLCPAGLRSELTMILTAMALGDARVRG